MSNSHQSMAGFKPLSLLFLVTFLTVTVVGSVSPSPPAIKAAYWPSWDSNFLPSAIDTSLFTHIYYAFVMPNNTTFKFEISKSEAASLSNFTSTLHYKNPPVKTLLSIGGANSDLVVFVHMASRVSSRRSFIKSAVDVARKYGFDGLDLDWEYPASPKEMKDFGWLIAEWRLQLEREARATGHPPLLLTAAVYFAVDFTIHGDMQSMYPTASIRKNLDWINAMCYDYHGSWNTSFTGAHAALFDPESKLSTNYGITSWIKAGVPTEKLVMGLPLYGWTWQLEDHGSHRVGARAISVGPGNGQMTFSQVEAFNLGEGATVVYDAETVSMYSYVGNWWIGYDDLMSVTMKVGFARAHGLRGYFFWAVNGDKSWKIPKQVSHAWGR